MRPAADIYKERAACPLYTAIAVIDGRWKPMIFQRLSDQSLGFGALRRAMPRVTTKVRVTAHGRSLGPVFTVLWQWGKTHLGRSGAMRGTIASSPAPRSSTAAV